MKKLFIHNIIFRLLSPIFSGIIAYLLILLINNNIGQLQEQFFGEELYVSIILAYVVHEFSRFLLWVFKFTPNSFGTIVSVLLHVFLSVLLSSFIVSILISVYYQYSSGYLPSNSEFITFNSIYSGIPILYVLLDLSYQYLNKVNTQKLEHELLIKQNIEEDFKQFKREINPNLLFQSFEAILSFIKEDINKVDEFINYLASIYRYILAKKKEQLIAFKEEQKMINDLILLYNHLPYRNVEVFNTVKEDFLVVPGTMLFILERIIKTTIVSKNLKFQIYIGELEDSFTISYLTEDKLLEEFNEQLIRDVTKVYSIYSTIKITIKMVEEKRVITIPKLKIKHS